MLLNSNEAVGHCERTPLNEQPPSPFFMPGVQLPGSRTYFRSGYCEWSAAGRVRRRAVPTLADGEERRYGALVPNGDEQSPG